MEPVFAKIYTWYSKNKRDLPWRSTNDPYKIWISEIILQQTKIDQGTNYYLRFIERFPSVEDLAKAPESEILKLWQGLGYYSRARNLHHAAKEIYEKYDSKLPEKYEELIRLKGIGPYTAAAIASIAFRLPYPTIDGNVYRFFSRYFGIHEPINSTQGIKIFQELATEVLDKKDPGTHNQAMMEFGAMMCTPKKPMCQTCPLQDSCYAFAQQYMDELPVKLKKTKKTNRYFFYLLMEENDIIYIKQRSDNDIWKNLYELPLIEMKENYTMDDFLQTTEFKKAIDNLKFTIREISTPVKHILSHQTIYANFIHIHIHQKNEFPLNFIPVNKKDISKFAIHRLMENYLKNKELL